MYHQKMTYTTSEQKNFFFCNNSYTFKLQFSILKNVSKTRNELIMKGSKFHSTTLAL